MKTSKSFEVNALTFQSKRKCVFLCPNFAYLCQKCCIFIGEFDIIL